MTAESTLSMGRIRESDKDKVMGLHETCMDRHNQEVAERLALLDNLRLDNP